MRLPASFGPKAFNREKGGEQSVQQLIHYFRRHFHWLSFCWWFTVACFCSYLFVVFCFFKINVTIHKFLPFIFFFNFYAYCAAVLFAVWAWLSSCAEWFYVCVVGIFASNLCFITVFRNSLDWWYCMFV